MTLLLLYLGAVLLIIIGAVVCLKVATCPLSSASFVVYAFVVTMSGIRHKNTS